MSDEVQNTRQGFTMLSSSAPVTLGLLIAVVVVFVSVASLAAGVVSGLLSDRMKVSEDVSSLKARVQHVEQTQETTVQVLYETVQLVAVLRSELDHTRIMQERDSARIDQRINKLEGGL